MSSPASALVPPHDYQAEVAVLGVALLDRDFVQIVADADPTIFYREGHRLIAKEMAALVRRGEPVDLVTLRTALANAGTLAEAGGDAALALLAEAGLGAGNCEAYLEIVKERAARRELLGLGIDLARQARDAGGTATSELTATALERLISLDTSRAEGIVTPDRFAQELALMRAIDGLPTGIVGLDDLMGGLAPGNLIVLAGRPGMGKTALACNIIQELALHRKIPTLFLSLEMTREEIGVRLVALEAGLDSFLLRKGRYSADVLARPLDSIASSRLLILDQTSMKLNDLQAQIRAAVGRHQARLIILDHVGRIQVPHSESRYVEMGRAAQGLKDIAKQLCVPVLALCQLNRAVEARSIRRPGLADLRDSGRIEEEADSILFLWTEEEYPERKPDALAVNLLLGKSRHGAVGEIALVFHKRIGRFTELSGRSEPADDPDRFTSAGLGAGR